MIALLRPDRLSVAAFGIEDPRLDPPGDGIPADALAQVERVASLSADFDLLQDEFLSGAPLARADHDRFVSLVNPIADHPVQRLEPFEVARLRRRSPFRGAPFRQCRSPVLVGVSRAKAMSHLPSRFCVHDGVPADVGTPRRAR